MSSNHDSIWVFYSEQQWYSLSHENRLWLTIAQWRKGLEFFLSRMAIVRFLTKPRVPDIFPFFNASSFNSVPLLLLVNGDKWSNYVNLELIFYIYGKMWKSVSKQESASYVCSVLHAGNKNLRTRFFCVSFFSFSNFPASAWECSQRRNLGEFSDNCWSPLHVDHSEK